MMVHLQPCMLLCRLSRCFQAYSQACSQVCPQLHYMIHSQPLGSMLPSSLSRGMTLPISPDYMLPYMLLGIWSRDLQSCSRQAPGCSGCIVGSGWHIVEEIITSVNIKVWTFSLLCLPQWDLIMPYSSHGIDNHNFIFCRKSTKLNLGTQIV